MTTSRRDARIPRLSSWLVGAATPVDDRGFVLADLAEEFRRLADESGETEARRWYRRQARSALIPGLRRRVLGARTQRVEPSSAAGNSTRSGRGLTDDLVYGARRLVRAPLVVLVTVISLGLGIGSTTSVFSVANAILLRTPQAIGTPEQIHAIYTTAEDAEDFGVTSFPDFQALQASTTLTGLVALRPGVVPYGEGELVRRVMVESVTAEFFPVFEVRPARGRFFRADEVSPGQAQRVTVVSHSFWQREFGGRDDILGHQIHLDGQPFTIVGVAPEGLLGRVFSMKIDAWVPIGIPGGFYHATDEELYDRDDREYMVFARSRPGVAIAAVETELAAIAAGLHEQFGADWEDDRGRPLGFQIAEGNPGFLPPPAVAALAATAAMLLVGAGLILLIACSNVASLFLARAEERRQEIALRAALGARRARLVRLLLAECGLLAAAGGFVGVVLAQLLVGMLGGVALPMDLPVQFDIALDWRVLTFSVIVSGFACLAFGFLPALVGSRADLVSVLKAGARSPGRRAGSVRIRSVLVVTQVAASVVLLVGAGLAIRSVGAATHIDQGFSTDRIAVAGKSLPLQDYSPDEAAVVLRDLADTLAAHPDVEAVALASNMERIFADTTEAEVLPDGYVAREHESRFVSLNAVDPGYIQMLGLDVLRGRTLDANDRSGAPTVVLVNQAFAQRFWSGADPLGRQLAITRVRGMGEGTLPRQDVVRVVGLIRDPDEQPGLIEVGPRMWVPLAQMPFSRVFVHAKSRTSAAAIVPVLRELVETDSGQLRLLRAQTLEDLVGFALTGNRMVGQAMRAAGAFALVLAFLGIYGIVSFSVTARSREMAIRKAIGAKSGQVVRGVMRDGVRLAIWGVGLGLLLVVPVATLLRGLLLGVHPLDPIAIGGGVGLILAAATLASLLPARRLSSLDPMAVLRDD